MDILTDVAIELPCNACGGRYEITLRQVLLSKETLHDGCLARSETECPPLAYAGLLDRKLIEEFLRTWERLAEAAHAAGGELTVQETQQQGRTRTP